MSCKVIFVKNPERASVNIVLRSSVRQPYSHFSASGATAKHGIAAKHRSGTRSAQPEMFKKLLMKVCTGFS
jgi:hypothetical protein